MGAGKMVEAIMMGLKDSTTLSNWGVYSPSGISAKRLAELTGAQFVSDLEGQDPDWIIVGCKPQQLKQLADTLNGRFKRSLYVSLLAAIDESTQLEVLKVQRLVRAMPNLSVKYKEGVTLLSSKSAQDELLAATLIFSRLGSAKVMTEVELEELTLLTGSGPALFYEFTQNLSRAFNSLTEKEREQLARQVLLGAAISSSQEISGLTPMIEAVTSKGGVTIAIINEWRAEDFLNVIKSGVKAGLVRTAELKKIILQS